MDSVKNGIVIVATGHPYYGRWAYNLALSIKANENFPIAVLHNGAALNHISEQQGDAFDYIIELPNDVTANQSSKLYAGQHSPFENTLLLDADMLWLPGRKPSELFAALQKVDFTAITEGSDIDPAKNYFFWADVNEIKEVYEIPDRIYQWRTEVVYFNEKGRQTISHALEITKNPRLKTVQQFAYAVPDELGINVAAAVEGITPHEYKWQPSYWHLMHGNVFPSATELAKTYYLISFGSNAVSGSAKKMYDQLMRGYSQQMRVQHIFPMESKRLFLKERDKI